MKIVDDHGLNPTKTEEINSILAQIGLVADCVTFTPSVMSIDEIRELGNKLRQNLEMGNGIAILRSTQRHFVLLHGRQAGGMSSIYDPLRGQDILETDKLITQNVGQISNDVISRSSQGNLIVLRPLQPAEVQAGQGEFVVNSSY